MTTHKPTDEQMAIIDAVARGQDNLMISAYAGTAKSTTLEMAAPGVRTQGLALAFNKKIATELQTRLPPNFKAQTLNSIGHGAWVRTLDRPTITLDDRKLGKIVTAIAKEQKLQLATWQWDTIRDAVKIAMQNGLSPKNMGQPFIMDTEENWKEIFDVAAMDSSDFDFLYPLAWDTLMASIDMAKAGQMSFDDQIYCPTILGGNWPRYPRVFVDEAQDLSPLNHRMLSLICTGLLAAVGDSRQAIYAFRGADSKSMNNMRALRPDWVDLNLTLTFRCPRSIVARQQSHAPGYTAAPGNVDGLFHQFPPRHDDGGEEKGGWSWNDLKAKAADINARDIAILCRNNAPLMSMAFKLIRNGIGCQMLGRDIGRGLIQLTTKLCKDDETSIVTFSDRLTKWLDKECAIAEANDKPQRVEQLTDKAECLRATIEGSSPSTAGELRSVLGRIFSREHGEVMLSSVHRAKGLEWPLVAHIDPWRIPSKQAQMAAARGDSAPLVQENNLRYVAETRTKHTLINADVEDFI
jgi:DNA helicase II / ATP-dependent DNA helicase PcrA